MYRRNTGSEPAPIVSSLAESEETNPRAVRTCAFFARLAAVIPIVSGIIVLLGWALKIQVLTTIPGFVSMKANTALAFLLLGAALWLVRPAASSGFSQRREKAGRWCAGLAALLGLLTLMEYVTGANFKIDELLFRDIFAKPGSLYPGRMAPASATAFFFLGLSLGISARRVWQLYLEQIFALVALLIGFSGLLGYFYQAPSLYKIFNYAAMALPTTVLFILVGLGALVRRPAMGVASVFTSAHGGGILARRFLPFALGLPLLLNSLRLWGEHRDVFSPEMGAAIFAVLTTIACSFLVLIGAQSLNRLDARRSEQARKLAEKDVTLEHWARAAEESARRFRFLSDTVPAIIWTSLPDGTLDYYNERWYSYTGLSVEETTAHGWNAVLHPEDRQPCAEHWARCVRTGESMEVEFRFQRAADETYRWHLVRALPMRDAKGEILQWVGTCTDIDDQKKTERELRDSQECFQVVLENISEGLVICDAGGKLLYWNRAGLEMHGIASLEEGRKSLAEFTTIFEMRALDGTFTRPEQWPLARIFRGETLRHEEHRVHRLDCEWARVLSYGGAVVQRSSGIALAFLTITDVTVRNRAEEALRESHESLEQKIIQRTRELSDAGKRLQTVFDAATDVAIIAGDLGGKITVFNRGAEKMLGYRSEEMLGRLPDLLHLASEVEARRVELSQELGSPVERLEVFVGRVRRGESEEREWTYVRKDGSHLKVALVITAIHAADGTITGFLGIAMDITQRKLVEEQLLLAKEAAEAANHAKSRFLANMSHEIRTPMNGVIGMTSLLLNTPLDALQQDYAETIRLSGENLLTVINGILDFSKIEAGEMNIERVNFDLEDVVAGTLEILAEAAQSKGLEITSLIDAGVRTRVQGDPGRLRQVLINLLGNGIKFTSQGEIDLQVQLKDKTPGRQTLRFLIRDTGIGISPATQAKLFQPFAQGDISTTRKYGGTGLGLAISRQLIEKMGGEMGVTSEHGKGSTFWFTLPFQQQPGLPERGTPTLVAPNVRVLIADDNETSGANLQAQLAVWKYETSLVRAGDEALYLLRRARQEGRPFALVLIDHDMPGMDGLDLARAIKADPALAATPLLLLVSRVHHIDKEAIRDAGIYNSVLKPVRQSNLLDHLMDVFHPIAPAKVIPNRPAKPEGKRTGRILMAEDNAVNQKLAVAQLRQLGYEVDAVGNGLLAAQALRERNYDIVLMDCHMPEMDGYEATSLIRNQEKDGHHTWIIAMTANAMIGDREKCLAAGMDDYINKPVRIGELDIVLNRAQPC